MNPVELSEILAAARGLRVAVLGDFCLDAYWALDDSCAEKSLETGLVTRAVSRQRYTPGAAGNVVMNLRALGVGRVDAFGVIGADPFGQELRARLGPADHDTDGLVCQATDWETHVYIKPCRGEREESRIDLGVSNRLADATADMLLGHLESRLADYHAVIINEQIACGIHHSARFRTALAALVARHPRTLFLLDGRHCNDAYRGTIRKLNDHEALRLCGTEREANEPVLRSEAQAASETLYARWNTPVFITRGARGCLLCGPEGVQEVPGLQIVGRLDTVGAGDSMLAGLAVGLAAGRDALAAATLGNFVAGVTVQKLHETGTATPGEVQTIGSDPDYVYRPELADDPRQANLMRDTEIEVITAAPSGLAPTHAIFDHDGTLSTLREGWEAVMEPVMVQAILGPRASEADEALSRRVVARVREFIDQTTGIQTLTQMEGLVAMVREFGCVADAEVLDAGGYKRMYLAALMNRVRLREARLRRGELAVADLTIKGAVDFIRALHAAGVQLHLASGTDHADVEAEARAMGYAGLFEGRIHGAVDGLRTEAKKRVIERILADIGDAGRARVIAFGDGPIEIRETHKAGGYAVGVASDELRRFGLNASKRTRLIRAGADLIIPDFSQGPRLLALLGIATKGKHP
jgi:bifunctional ADP-heptose synthase (sugar kinase/adenylyltransferase)/phosphoglycolate phosphatase-like HAD superfamily hydrolase